MYKIYVLSNKDSRLPYEVEGVKNEVLKMIDDFRSGNPKLQECEWEEGGKNYTFKNEFFNKTGRELTEKVIKHNIISEIRFNNFIDVIYPQWCERQTELCFISEYSMPKDRFTCIAEIEHRSIICANENQSVIERVFLPNHQVKDYTIPSIFDMI